jgi:hypothetical protein
MRTEDLLIDGLLEGIVLPAQQKTTSIESIKQHQLVTHQQRHSYLVSSIVPSSTSRGAPSFVPYLEQETYYNAFVWMVDWIRDFILCSAISEQTSAAMLTSSSPSLSTRGIIGQRPSHRVLVDSTSLLRRTLAFQDLAHLSLCSVFDNRSIPQGLMFDALAVRRRELFYFHWDAVVVGTCTMMDAMAMQVKQRSLLCGPSLPAALAYHHPLSCSIYSLTIDPVAE